MYFSFHTMHGSLCRTKMNHVDLGYVWDFCFITWKVPFNSLVVEPTQLKQTNWSLVKLDHETPRIRVNITNIWNHHVATTIVSRMGNFHPRWSKNWGRERRRVWYHPHQGSPPPRKQHPGDSKWPFEFPVGWRLQPLTGSSGSLLTPNLGHTEFA